MIEALKDNLVDRIGKYTSLRKVSAHEWAGPCIKCGGHDRFRINDERGWFCRSCTGTPGSDGHWGDLADFTNFAFGWSLGETLKSIGADRKLNPDEIARLNAERKAAQIEQRQQEVAKQAKVHQGLTQSGIWKTYHQNLSKYPEARQIWNERGLSDEWIDYYQLGYCPRHEWYTEDVGSYYSASLTIPYLYPVFTQHPDGGAVITRQLVNLKHRLLMDKPPMGKYLPEKPGAGNHIFWADADQQGKDPVDLLIVEGEIKAMVTWSSLWVGDDCIYPISVVGVPGHGWREEWLEVFDRANRVLICMDPDKDAQKAADKLAARLGPKARNIRLPDKIDDLINIGVLDTFKLVELLEN